MQQNSQDHELAFQFQEYFELQLANTPSLREEVFRIRYDVYCQELGYEPINIFADRLEQDAYDPYSVHCLLWHHKSESYAGCIRLILPTEVAIAEPFFPFEKVCSRHTIDFTTLSRLTCCEISRIAVRSHFRRRPGEKQTPDGLILPEGSVPTMLGQRSFPFIAVSLYLAGASIAHDLGQFNYVFALMEPRLARHLRFFGIQFEAVGEAIEFHGKRVPFAIDANPKRFSSSLPAPIRSLFERVRTSFSADLNAAPAIAAWQRSYTATVSLPQP
jgi:N-acyl amino acid synthase of PEP-CTERM/exosortase system